jgi:hypothetical protein
MTPPSSISQHLERQSLVVMESTIPAAMTVDQWRRLRSARRRRPRRRPANALAAARRVVPLRPKPCDHLHETTTRYDHHQKLLHFLLVCPSCHTEKVVESVPYEPRFEPAPTVECQGATIYQLPSRRSRQLTPRAA